MQQRFWWSIGVDIGKQHRSLQALYCLCPKWLFWKPQRHSSTFRRQQCDGHLHRWLLNRCANWHHSKYRLYPTEQEQRSRPAVLRCRRRYLQPPRRPLLSHAIRQFRQGLQLQFRRCHKHRENFQFSIFNFKSVWLEWPQSRESFARHLHTRYT